MFKPIGGKRVVHVMLMNDYLPKLCKLTLPTIEAWAEKIDARVNYITRRRWPDWPLLTEKLQVWYDGMDNDWNILLDADILVHPDAPDMLGTLVPPDHVAAKDAFHAHTQMRTDTYFQRDGRDIGLSGCFVITSRWCHDLWRPITEEMTKEEVCKAILQERKCVDEYCISRNMARYGLKLTAPVDPATSYNLFYHLGAFGRSAEQMLEEARAWMKQNHFYKINYR